jgi:hypothetical protein
MKPLSERMYAAWRVGGMGWNADDVQGWIEEVETLEVRIEGLERKNHCLRQMYQVQTGDTPADIDIILAHYEGALACLHLNTVMEMRGSRRLVEGQVDDDLHEVEVCKNCGASLAAGEKT